MQHHLNLYRNRMFMHVIVTMKDTVRNARQGMLSRACMLRCTLPGAGMMQAIVRTHMHMLVSALVKAEDTPQSDVCTSRKTG